MLSKDATLAGALALTILVAADQSRSGEFLPTTGVLTCRGVLTFGDALARAVSLRVDRPKGEIVTGACRTYAQLTRFCTGTLIRVEPHQFLFDGAASLENTKFWADLRRPSKLLTASIDGTEIETMRVVFLGRCVAARAKR